MALQDILAAITAEADERIAAARTEHQRSLTKLREESERRLAGKKQEIAVNKAQRKDQLRAKAQSHALSQKRNAVLAKKKELLDRAYAEVVKKLGDLDVKDTEKLLRACVKMIDGKGVIHPAEKHAAMLKKICPSEQFRMEKPIASAGGFLFVSEKEEQDFTFEYLVEHVLRPATELETSHALV